MGTFRGPIIDDIDGASRHATSIGKFWSNVPEHIHESLKAPATLDSVPQTQPQLLDKFAGSAKDVIASTGWLPERWRAGPPTYYNGQISLVPYKRGQTAAYHYPQNLVPRDMACRFPLDMYVDPVFQTSDPAKRWQMQSRTLFPTLQGKVTLLLIFSGEPLSSIFTGLERWTSAVSEEFSALPRAQVLKMHCCKGWFSRRTHQLTKYNLRRATKDPEHFTTFVYRGKWKFEYVYKLHLYDKNLPVLLLLDRLAYIRWHAVGLPNDEASALFKKLSRQLSYEKK